MIDFKKLNDICEKFKFKKTIYFNSKDLEEYSSSKFETSAVSRFPGTEYFYHIIPIHIDKFITPGFIKFELDFLSESEELTIEQFERTLKLNSFL